MTDLDARIRSYVNGWSESQDAPPDFDAAFERAVVPTRRRPAMLWSGLAAAACVAALAVTVAVVSSRSHHGDEGRAAAGSPAATSQSGPQAGAQSGAPSGDPSSDSAEPATRAMLMAIARRLATVNGDDDASAAAVRTTLHKAVAAAGDGVDGPDHEVWLIQVHGTFVCGQCSGPAGAPPVRGHYIADIVSHDGLFTETDFGLTDNPIDLSQLGQVITLIP